MFSGIVEEIGTVDRVDGQRNLSVLKVRIKNVSNGIRPGASIAVNGACLTVAGITKHVLTFEVMRETLRATTMGGLKPGDRVNLERALKVSSRLDGHIVTGHVDAIGQIRSKVSKINHTELYVAFPSAAAKYIVPKGSVCLDGVSLTVGQVKKAYFTVYLVPFTVKMTTLGFKQKGDKVNIETDILAKYVLNQPVGAVRGCKVKRREEYGA